MLHANLVVLVNLAYFGNRTGRVLDEDHEMNAALLMEHLRRQRDQQRRGFLVSASEQGAVPHEYAIAHPLIAWEAVLANHSWPVDCPRRDRLQVPRNDSHLHRHDLPASGAAPI